MQIICVYFINQTFQRTSIMPNKTLPKIKYLVLGALGAISIAACSSGSCDTNNGGGGT